MRACHCGLMFLLLHQLLLWGKLGGGEAFLHLSPLTHLFIPLFIHPLIGDAGTESLGMGSTVWL